MREHKFPYESFIAGWYIDPQICDDLIDLFNDNKEHQKIGVSIRKINVGEITNIIGLTEEGVELKESTFNRIPKLNVEQKVNKNAIFPEEKSESVFFKRKFIKTTIKKIEAMENKGIFFSRLCIKAPIRVDILPDKFHFFPYKAKSLRALLSNHFIVLTLSLYKLCLGCHPLKDLLEPNKTTN